MDIVMIKMDEWKLIEKELKEYGDLKETVKNSAAPLKNQKSVCINSEACKKMKEELDELRAYKKNCIHIPDVAKAGIKAIKYRFEHYTDNLSGEDILKMTQSLESLLHYSD